MRSRRYIGGVRVGAIIALVAAVVVTLSGTFFGRSVHAAHTAQHSPFTVVLSNNFLGNDWRPEMERIAMLTSKLPPFKGKITLRIQNAQNTTEAQIASLNDIIQSHPNAILLDAGSATALNPTVQRACAAGIIVVSFDQTVTAPCAWKVTQNHGLGQVVVGEWMAQVLHGHGGIFLDRGLPAAPVSKQIQDGFLKGLHMDGPRIKVLAEYDGMYAQGPEQQAVSSLLVGHPNVNGVMTQGYCRPVFNAFRAAGKKTVPTTCYGYNGELVACAHANHKCAILTGSPIVVQIALKLALDALQHKPVPPKNTIVPVPMTLYITRNTQSGFHPKTKGVKIETIKLGKNAYPNLPPGLALPFTLPQYHITARQAAGR
jgi:ribose transport system substrate-binding protein